jgi:cytochrome b involved in lipid metabolism
VGPDRSEPKLTLVSLSLASLQLSLAALLTAASAYLLLVPLTPPIALDAPSSSKRLISAQEVALHNSEDSVWVIINDPATGRKKVWDLTDFLELHPGGEDILIAWSGKDAS